MAHESVASIHLLATLETDPTRYHGEHPVRPRLLEAAPAEQVLAHLAADLERMYPDIARCRLAMPGALYDQTQVLRPGFPLFGALAAQLQRSGASRLALGAVDGRMPQATLAPDPRVPAGLLQNLPLVASGPADLCEAMAESMEHRFLEQGQLSAHSAKGLEANFGIALTHARFMTLTDLRAMLRLQLEHFGFLPLWELLDSALCGSEGRRSATGRGGQRFTFEAGSVRCQFETFDYWARRGAGKDLAETEGDLGSAYADWTREYRQYVATLQAHAVPVVQQAPDGDALPGGYLVEETEAAAPPGAAEVTEHGSPELGVLAVTVVRGGRQFHYYPLTPEGLNALHAIIRAEGLGPAGFSYPGRLAYDPEARRLMADTADGGDG